MFKKIFGPKKVEAVGKAIPITDLRESILSLFPKAIGINDYLTIKDSKDSPDGFDAVWELYARDTDGDGNTRNYLVTHTIKVDIRPDENAVYLKSKHFGKTVRSPKGDTVHKSWIPFIQIGKIEGLEPAEEKRFNVYSQKKELEPLVNLITMSGWDVYR